MIQAIGIDSVEIARFKHWSSYSSLQLKKVFSSAEIDYCLQIPAKSAERFAVRFVAKEALYKALCSAVPEFSIPFLKICRSIEVSKDSRGVPKLSIAGNYFEQHEKIFELRNQKLFLSITHTSTVATAFVIIAT